LTLVADVVQSRAICNQGVTRNLKKEAIDLARHLVDAIEEKKGEDILLMDIHAQCSFADYFVLCSGSSERQLKAILDAIQETAKKEFGVSLHHVEGKPETGWVLMDLGDVIIHVFSPSQRRFYSLESLWKESPILLRIK
jgi:ribosome-associated protein